MSDKIDFQIFGVYNGTSIRCKQLETEVLISATDLKTASEATAKFRFDRWRNTEQIQSFLFEASKKLKVDAIKNKSGMIVEVAGVLEVISGGSRDFQGTYISKKLAILYTQWISQSCHKWLKDLLTERLTEQVVKAKKVEIKLGNFKIDVYQIPNGEYRLSQIQISQLVEAGETSFRDFLVSKSPEALPYKNCRFVKMVTGSNNVQLKGIPIFVAAAYWTKESIKGNEIASRLLGACAIESIERRADKAFGKEILEEEYNQRFANNYKKIIASCPKSFITQQKAGLNISVYSEDSKRLSKFYPKGVIPGFTTKERIIERLVYLSCHAQDEAWKLKARQELYQEGDNKKAKYPDLMTDIINLGNTKAIFIFQVYKDIVKSKDVEDCISRRYIQLAEKMHAVDNSFLLLVAPLGADRDANSIIQDELNSGKDRHYDSIGIMTIKELAEFYYHQALPDKESPKNISNIKKDFNPFMEYKIHSSIDKIIQFSIPFASVS